MPLPRRSFLPVGAFSLFASSLIVVAALAAGSARPTGQAGIQQPRFRSGVALVEVDVTAVDDRGRHVSDLRQDEFEVSEDGRTREVVAFTRFDLPLVGLHPLRRIDVASNAGADQGRVVFLVVDDANTAPAAAQSIRTAVSDLLGRLAPGDRVGMLFVSQRKEGAFELTTNHAAVMDAMQTFRGQATRMRVGAESGLGDLAHDPAAALGEASVPAGMPAPPRDLKQAFDRLRPYSIVADVSDHLAPLPQRRKVLVYLGQGLGRLPDEQADEGEQQTRERLALRQAIAAAHAANLVVYVLDPRRTSPVGPRELVALDPATARAPREERTPTLSSLTGGTSDEEPGLANQIERIVSDAGAYYILGYRADPPDERLWSRLKAKVDPWEGFRRIAVRTTRLGVTLRARPGYWPRANSGGGPSGPGLSGSVGPAADAVRSLTPLPDLALRSIAIPFRGQGGKHVVAVALQVESPSMASAAEKGLQESVQLRAIVVEPGGRVSAGYSSSAKMIVARDRGAGLRGGRYVVCSTLALKPGRYQVRMAVSSRAAGSTGSVYQDVVVPDFDAKALTLSGVVVNATGSEPSMPVARAQVFTALCPFVPTFGRRFLPTDIVKTYVRAFRRGLQGPATFRAAVSRPDASDPVWTDVRQASFTRDGQAEYLVALPLRTLEPGSYRLSITVQDRLGRDWDRRLLDFELAAAEALPADSFRPWSFSRSRCHDLAVRADPQ